MNKRLDTLVLVVIIAAVLILFALTFKTWQIMKTHDHAQKEFIPVPEESISKRDTLKADSKDIPDKGPSDTISWKDSRSETKPQDPGIPETVKKNESPSEIVQEKQAPTISSRSMGRFKVIAGSFSVHENAIRMAERLTNMGYTAEIVQLEDSQFERVLAGRFQKQAQAEEVVRQLIAQSIPSYVLIGY